MNASRPAALPRAAWLVLALSLLLSFWIATRFPLLDPDEGRNAEIAREMAVSGDVVIPHLAAMPYLDKPPLLFAAAAASIRVLGHTPLAARLPSIVAALLTLLVLARAAVRLDSPGHATRTVAFVAAAPLFAVLSAYVIFDMPLTLCVTVVWTGLAAELADRPRDSRRAAMFLAVALGVLDKGPIMLVWALGTSVAAALLLRRRAPLAWLAWGPGWAIVLLLAGGWFALALRRHPEYARYAFLEESLERLTSGSFKREQPWWFAPAVVVGGALPWSLATPWRLPRSQASVVAAGVVLFATLFFSLSHSKLVTYMLPAFPALAWWAAESWRAARATARRMAAVVGAAFWLAAAAAAVLGAAGAFGRAAPPPVLLLPAALAASAMAVLALVAIADGAAPLRATVLLAFTPVVLVGGAGALGGFAQATSGAALAAALQRAGGGTVLYEDCYSYGSDYLLGRTSSIVSRDGHELTSNYVVRYRDRLRARGQWRLYDSTAAAPRADIMVRPTRAAGDRAPALPWPVVYVDSRFTALRARP